MPCRFNDLFSLNNLPHPVKRILRQTLGQRFTDPSTALKIRTGKFWREVAPARAVCYGDRMMKRIPAIFLLLTIFFSSATPASALETEEKPFPPFYIRKVAMGGQFSPFELTDLDGKVWTNRPYLKKAMIFITGSWALRHDLRKWAEHISMRYILMADILWIFNPCGTEFADHRKRAEDAFAQYKTAVPVVIDEHSLIGRSLKIDYDIPTIIGIDRFNRLAFCYESPFNMAGQNKLYALIRTRLMK